MSEDRAEYMIAVEEKPKTLKERLAEDPEAFDFSDIETPQPKYTLPQVLGDYRAVEGHPGWFMRPMRLRQELRAMELLKRTEHDAASNLQDAVLLGSLLLYRLMLPADPEEARGAMVAHVKGERSAMRGATEEEIVDEFTSDTLNAAVLAPMGFGVKMEADEGNA